MPPIQWSSPTRQHEGRNLSPIPTEICLAIFTYIRTIPFHKRLLRELSLVCRQFYAIIIPWIFENVEFSSNARKSFSSSSPDRASLSRRIRAGESTALTLAKHVKRCTFTQWNLEAQEEALEWVYAELLLLHTNAVRAMSNLKELELSRSTLTKAFFKAMPSLPHLESLKMTNCYIPKDISPKHLEKSSSLKLKSLHFKIHYAFNFKALDTNIHGPFDAFFNHLNLKYLENVYSSSEYLLLCLLRVEGDLALTSAFFSKIDDQKSLVQFFHKTPSLRSFSTFSINNSKPPLELGSNMLPNLKTLKVPLSIYNTLLGRRSVGEVEFLSTTTLNEFQGSEIVSKPFTSMCVPAHIYQGFPFGKLFPKLLKLEVYYRIKFVQGHCTDATIKEIETVLLKWPQQPANVRSLILDITSDKFLLLDLEEQHLIISQIIHPIFPKLRQCRLVSCISWFLVEEDAQWKPEIVEGLAQEVASIMPSSDYVDFNGFLEDFIKLAGF